MLLVLGLNPGVTDLWAWLWEVLWSLMLVYNTSKDGEVARSQSLWVHSTLSRRTRTLQCLSAHPKAGPSTLGKGKWKRGKGSFIFFFLMVWLWTVQIKTQMSLWPSAELVQCPRRAVLGSTGCPWGWHSQQGRAVPSPVRAVGFSKASRAGQARWQLHSWWCRAGIRQAAGLLLLFNLENIVIEGK